MKVSKSGGHAQPRYFVLFSDMLMYCKFRGNPLAGGILELPKHDALEVCCVLPLKHTAVEHVVGKGVFTVQCQKESLVLYTTNAEDSHWVEDIRKAVKQLKKNSATLKRESSKFEPMRKPDILKLRRESLSKIMLMRKTEESKREELKTSTSTRSPLLMLTPRKRKPDYRLESPTKMNKIIESPSVSSPSSRTPTRRTPPRKAKDMFTSTPVRTVESTKTASPRRTPTRTAAPLRTPIKRVAAPLVPALEPEKEKSPEVELRSKAKTSFKKQPRNSLRSLSLNRTTKLKREEAKSKTIFRSPSIYDEPKPIKDDEVFFLENLSYLNTIMIVD